MVYSSVSGAVVAALAAGEKGAAKAQAWQKLYQAAEEEGGCLASLGRGVISDRTQIDYWISARLHHSLEPWQWDVLVGKYSTNKNKKVQAIAALRTRIASPASALFVYKAVTAWAIPKSKGARHKAAQSVTVEVPLDAPSWRQQSMINGAIAAAHSAQYRVEQQQRELIVLPDSFYDMNTWELDGAPESTRRRWRAGIVGILDGMLNEALRHAELILLAEEVLQESTN